jgi:hypothetical protein
MIKKIVFNLTIILILAMIATAVIRANKPGPGITKTNLNNIEEKKGLNPKEAKYYKVIEE